MLREMRSQSSFLAHSTKSLSSLTLNANQTNNKEQQHRSTTPVVHHSKLDSNKQSIQMTTGGGISGNNANLVTAQQKSATSTLSSCNTIASSSTINTLSKASTISSTIRHSNGNLSTTSNNNNNTTTAVNNNKTNDNTNTLNNNNNNNEGNNNQNPNWSKMQTLEQRKLELEKLLNEKNWLLQQIHKQEAQILNGSYENFNLYETGKVNGNIGISNASAGSGNSSTILRRKGSSSLKLTKSNVHFNGKSNRFTLSKSDYDLAQENKLNNHQSSTTNQNAMSTKKRQGPPQKTNSFHDSTSGSALSLTKSPSFEYNGNTAQQSGGGVSLGAGSSSSHSIKYSIVRPHHGSSENLTNTLGVTQCDKYYLSPTTQMYTNGSGFIKASQNIKQCLSPSPLHKIIALNDTKQQQQIHLANGHSLVHHNGSQPHLEQYESVDALSLSPSTNFNFDQGSHTINQHSSLWRTISNADRSAWCDSTSYVELDSDGGNPYNNLKPLAKKVLPTSISGSSLQQSPEATLMGNFYPVGGMIVGSYSNTLEKAGDEVSISSVNSETNKKPKNKQWMESSLDGPIIRPNILQSTTPVGDGLSICPALSPTLSQNHQYSYYNVARQTTTASSATTASGKLTPSPAPTVGGNSLLVSVVTSRPPTRTLTHHSHPHHKQSYRERAKLSSQSMSSGSYRTSKPKLDDDNSHLSHSTSYLNVDTYHHHHFNSQPPPPPPPPLQQQQQQYNHYHIEIPNNSSFTVPHMQQFQQQQKPSQNSPVQKFSPTTQQQQCALSVNGSDDYIGSIRYATSVATPPSRLCNPSQAITKNPMNATQKPLPPVSLSINTGQQLSPQANALSATSPDIRIESPKNMTVVQQATFLPYKEVTKPFEMSDFYKYSTKFRQKEANTATMSKIG